MCSENPLFPSVIMSRLTWKVTIGLRRLSQLAKRIELLLLPRGMMHHLYDRGHKTSRRSKSCCKMQAAISILALSTAERVRLNAALAQDFSEIGGSSGFRAVRRPSIFQGAEHGEAPCLATLRHRPWTEPFARPREDCGAPAQRMSGTQNPN